MHLSTARQTAKQDNEGLCAQPAHGCPAQQHNGLRMHRKHACAHEKTTVGMTERARTARARAPVLHCPQQPGGHQLSTLEPRTCARRQWLSCMHRSNTHTDMQHSTQREQHWNTDTCITTRRCSRDAVLDPWACSNSTRTSSAHNMHAGITEACRTERNGDIVTPSGDCSTAAARAACAHVQMYN